MGLYPLIDEATFDQLHEWWSGDAVPEWADSHQSFFDELAFRLSLRGLSGPAILKGSLADTDIIRRRAALRALTKDPALRDPDVEEAVRLAFAFPDTALKTVALWGCIFMGHFLLERPQIEQLYHGDHERLSALAMVYLSLAFPDEQIEILRAGLHGANPRQREYACDEVGERGLTILMEDLTPLCDDPDEAVAQAAKASLDGLWLL